MLDVSIDDPRFGKSFACKCAREELTHDHTERLERYSNLGPLTRLTFENLQPEGLDSDPIRQTQYKSCYNEARAFADKPDKWLVLTGPSGCGKTHVAAAIANHCIRQNIPAFWTIVPELLDHLRATFGPNSDITYDELFERVKTATLLILDDLGTHSATSWAEEKLFQILNHRFNAQLPTVVTTINLDDLDERLQTRLLNPRLSEKLSLRTDGPPVYIQIGGPSLEMMSSMRFSNFDIGGMNANKIQRDSLRQALSAARQFADSPEDWLVLVGPAGSGKTHLAAAITNRQISSNRPVVFSYVPELLEQLRPGPKESARKKDSLSITGIKNCPVLVMDDLSIENLSAWARDRLYQILNYRYSARMATVVTATDSEIESLDARLYSRIIDPKISTVVPIGAPDYRGGTTKTKPSTRKKR